MKKTMIASMLAVSTALLMAAPAHAVTYNLDELLGKSNQANSGDSAELLLTEQLSSQDDLMMISKVNVNASQVFDNEGTTDQHYLSIGNEPALRPEPGYFLLKFGTGGTGVAENTYVFRNLAEFTKLVWSDSQVQNLTADFRNFGVGRLSHYTTFNDPTQVPEPASLLLFGMGLAAAGAARMRRR